MAALPPHIIDTKWLGDSPIQVALELPAKEISQRLGAGHEFRPAGVGRASLDVAREATSTVVVRGQLSVAMEATCSRCLEAVAREIRCRVAHRLVGPDPGAPSARRGHAVSAADSDAGSDGVELVGQTVVRPLGARHLDLMALLLEDLVMALPMRALCRESCRGLCSSCGARVGLEPCAFPAADAAAPARGRADARTEV